MKGKVCIITGGNTGLGFEVGLALARKGAKICIWCRSEQKGYEARKRILKEVPISEIVVIEADLSNRKAIERGAGQILSTNPKIDVLINNAATVLSDRALNGEGLEMQFAVNHLGHFWLTHLLLPAMLKGSESRIINVGSRNHSLGTIHFGNLNLDGKYHLLRAYSQSKLANVMFTYELNRRLKRAGFEHVNVNCIDPGLNNTGIGEKKTNLLHRLVWKMRRRLGKHPREGAETLVYLASSSKVSGISGQYWHNMQPVPSAPQSYREEDAQRLWDISHQLCNIESFFPANFSSKFNPDNY